MDKAEQQFKHDNDKTNNTPFFLRLSNISTTLYAWSEEHQLDLPTGEKKYVNHILDKIDNEDGEKNAVVNTINQSKKTCGFVD
eukprot:388556-Ditylum_brightwellii.AAC.1